LRITAAGHRADPQVFCERIANIRDGRRLVILSAAKDLGPRIVPRVAREILPCAQDDKGGAGSKAYRFSMIALANSDVFSSFAPSI
jgi:hypothetical protein